MTASAAQRTVRKAQREQWERHLETRLLQHDDIPDTWVREYEWHPNRKFRADFAWVNWSLLVEVDGGTFSKGRSGHSTGIGIARDMVKSNEAAILGWSLLRFDAPMVRDDIAIAVIVRWFEAWR